MYLIHSPSSDPHFNLALEEHLFNETSKDFILIYINRDSVVCGKHQNAVAESNSQFLHENGVPLIRRFSGGGTVYHDLGNINFSFISTGEKGKIIDFKRYALPVVHFLKSLNLPASLSERNDILLDGYKISGHAAHAKNVRSLHHGTLLFSSNLQTLSLGLKSQPDKFESRAVQSVRSKVATIDQYLKHTLDINEFVEMLSNQLMRDFETKGRFDLTEEDRKEVEELVESKYKSFDWNYGYGPDYRFSCTFKLTSQEVQLNVQVSKGHIVGVENLNMTELNDTFTPLIGTRHQWSEIDQKLKDILGKDHDNQIIHHFF